MLNQREFEIYQKVNSYLKVYPTFSKLYLYKTPVDQRIQGYEDRRVTNRRNSECDNIDNTSIIDSIRRTKTTITDIALSNNFSLFVTFTFDPKKVDRTNALECKRKMRQWLKRQNERNGKFSYLIVPEFHKDGKALHFHALFQNYTGQLINSGIKQNSRTIFNIKSYQLGFSTAVEIDNQEKVSSYIKKYITKDMPQFAGKQRYWCSKDLKRPTKIINPVIDPFTFREILNEKGYSTENLTIYKTMLKIPLQTKKESLQWQIQNKQLTLIQSSQKSILSSDLQKNQASLII